ncbi:Src kinase-associated phosphoprotein 1 [Varanus komodoensis]|nr:Src kinase-associated phosphoprotein 1 [Varanus komodoensis]
MMTPPSAESDEDLDLLAPNNREAAGTIEETEKVLRCYSNYYQGLWDCTGGHQDELSFQRGDLIYIVSKVDLLHSGVCRSNRLTVCVITQELQG